MTEFLATNTCGVEMAEAITHRQIPDHCLSVFLGNPNTANWLRRGLLQTTTRCTGVRANSTWPTGMPTTLKQPPDALLSCLTRPCNSTFRTAHIPCKFLRFNREQPRENHVETIVGDGIAKQMVACDNCSQEPPLHLQRPDVHLQRLCPGCPALLIITDNASPSGEGLCTTCALLNNEPLAT